MDGTYDVHQSPNTRLVRKGVDRVEYLAKDTRGKQRVPVQYKNEEFVDLLGRVHTKSTILG
jgi:hypothetical protein